MGGLCLSRSCAHAFRFVLIYAKQVKRSFGSVDCLNSENVILKYDSSVVLVQRERILQLLPLAHHSSDASKMGV